MKCEAFTNTLKNKNIMSKKAITRIALLILLTFSLSTVFTQVPQAFNYQAVARDG